MLGPVFIKLVLSEWSWCSRNMIRIALGHLGSFEDFVDKTGLERLKFCGRVLLDFDAKK